MKSPELRLGGARFDPEAGKLTDAEGAPVELRHQAMEVLKLLAARPGKIVTRAEIVARVWDNRAGADDGLVHCIAEIRRALSDGDKTILETIPRKGYRLVPPVRAARFGKNAILALALALLVAVGLALGWRPWADAASDPAAPVIAVLPFETSGGDVKETGIDVALGDAIIAALAGYREFDVIARQSSFRFRDTERDIVGIGAELGADYLVQGRLGLTDRTLRIAVQLIDTTDATLEMVDAFEMPLDELFDARDRIAHRVANTVSGKVVTLSAQAQHHPGAVDALILDNKARLLFQSGPSREKWRASLAMSDEAIASYPEAEWGYIGKALILRTGVRFGYDDGAAAEVLDEAERAAEQAIALNPYNYAGHFALGRVRMQQGDITGSVAALKRAAELNPSSAMVLNGLGQSYLYADDRAALAATVARVKVIDPLPGTLTLWLRAWAAWQMGDCTSAQETVAAMSHAPLDAAKLRAVILVCTGDTEAAAAEIAAYLEKRPGWTLTREIEVNAGNWQTDGPRDRWLAALSEAGIPE